MQGGKCPFEMVFTTISSTSYSSPSTPAREQFHSFTSIPHTDGMVCILTIVTVTSTVSIVMVIQSILSLSQVSRINNLVVILIQTKGAYIEVQGSHSCRLFQHTFSATSCHSDYLYIANLQDMDSTEIIGLYQ